MINQKWLKLYIKCNTQKGIEAAKNDDKDGEGSCKLLNNAIYCKAMENMMNRVDWRLAYNEKDYLKRTLKPSFVAQQIFEKDLVAIHKIKNTLILAKYAYIGILILELSKGPMHDFHYDYIKNKLSVKWKMKLQPKMLWILLSDSSEYKKAKSISKNVIATLLHWSWRCFKE